MSFASQAQDITIDLQDEHPNLKSQMDKPTEIVTKDAHKISTTTGGMENSCHSCMLGLGVVTFVIGISTTSMAYATDSLDSVLFVLGISILLTGVCSIVFSCIWKRYRKRKKAKRNEDLAVLCYEYKQKTITI